MSHEQHGSPNATCADLARIAAADGTPAMFDALAVRLRADRRWHALFDLRLVQARLALGLLPFGDPSTLDPAVRERIDEASLAACREVGWPLLDEGHVAAAWMYLRAAAPAGEVAARLRSRAAAHAAADPDDEQAARELQEIVGVSLWEGVDPALGIEVVLRVQGTCNAVTAFDQAVARLPAERQRPAAATLVAHLHGEVAANVAADLRGRGVAVGTDAAACIPDLLAAAGGMTDDPTIHVDVSHLQSVLRLGRVCVDRVTLERAWELAVYGCRLPADVTYPGDPPFEDVALASRLFYGAQLGRDVDEAVAFFRRAADRDDVGPAAGDVLVLLLWRLGRPAEALTAALDRPRDDASQTTMHVPGLLPSLVELAAASGTWEPLLEACRARGDEITFAAALASRAHQSPGQSFQTQQPAGPQSPHGAG